MQHFSPKQTKRNGPEAIIQQNIITMLRQRGWYVKPTHGNTFQAGVPDLFCCHKDYGHRWVEVKNPRAYCFTKAQQIEFPLICKNGSGVWVLVAATETEYKKLFDKPNWYKYLKL